MCVGVRVYTSTIHMVVYVCTQKYFHILFFADYTLHTCKRAGNFKNSWAYTHKHILRKFSYIQFRTTKFRELYYIYAYQGYKHTPAKKNKERCG